MKKRVPSLAVVIGIIIAFAMGVFGASGLQSIKAYTSSLMSVKVNGAALAAKTSSGEQLKPILYKNVVYLPAQALAQKLGAKYSYSSKGNGAVVITSNKSGSSTTPTNPSTSTDNPGVKNSTATGTIDDPIKIGERYSWSLHDEYPGYDADYSFTVKNAEPISISQIEKLGFKVQNTNKGTSYVTLNTKLELRNVKIKSAGKYGDKYLRTIKPIMNEVKTAEGHLLIGGAQDYGFTGSLSDAIDSTCKFKQLKVGQEGSYTVTGKIIVEVVNNESNCLVLKGNTDKTEVYFKLN